MLTDDPLLLMNADELMRVAAVALPNPLHLFASGIITSHRPHKLFCFLSPPEMLLGVTLLRCHLH